MNASTTRKPVLVVTTPRNFMPYVDQMFLKGREFKWDKIRGRIECEGETYLLCTSVIKMRGLRARAVVYGPQADTLPDFEQIREYAAVVERWSD